MTSYLSVWIRHLSKTEEVDPGDVERAFRDAVLRITTQRFPDGPRVRVELGRVGPQVWLEYTAAEEPGEPGTLPVSVLRSTPGMEETEVGERVDLRVCFTHHPALSQRARELADALSPHLEHPLHVPEIWPDIDRALEDVVWEIRGGRPAPRPGTLGERLVEGLGDVQIESDDVRIAISNCTWRQELTSPTLSHVKVDVELRVRCDDDEPFTLHVSNGLGWSESQWQSIASIPAIDDDGPIRDALRTLAAEKETLRKLSSRAPEWTGRLNKDDWFAPLIGAIIAPAPANSLFAWLANNDAFEGPDQTPGAFGQAWKTIELTEETGTTTLTVPLGRVSPDALQLASPDETLRDWFDARMDDVPGYARDHLTDEPFAQERTRTWPLLDTMERCVRDEHAPEPTPPIVEWDDFTVKRVAERLAVTPPERRNGLETAEAMKALRGWSGDVWPVRIAAYELAGWRLELVAERSFPWNFTSILLAEPDGEWIPILFNDIWAARVRWCLDGDRFAFQAFVDLLRLAIDEAGLDASADAQARAFLFFSERGRVEIARQMKEADPDADVDLFFAQLDEQGEDALANSIASRPEELLWGELSVTEWLGFDDPDRSDRWVLDWRVDYPAVVTSRPMVEDAPGMYGFQTELVRQLEGEAPEVWRRFLTEVVDHRFARAGEDLQ